MDIRHTVTGLYSHLEFGACLVGFLPIMAASHALHRGDPTQREPGRWMRRLGRTVGQLTPLWTFTIEGEAPPDIEAKPHVVIANHESQADPFLLSWLPWDMRWVAKEELFKPPVLGWVMTFGGDIPLRRGDGTSVRAMMAECERAIDAGISIMMFPEGTRAQNGELLRFRDGAFDLAIRTRAPVLPIAIAGTRQMRPKHSRWLGKAHACAKILPAVPTAHLHAEDIGTLRDRCRDIIAAELPDLRARYG
ncbi:lysophospholipid acyltransferase family protein [Pendulispora albinea]|uniref:1-acyl-sn-glycerol-3-phosphate acyltransferase n=1 Tax=Pendulispora albinea TaxID=2741071 RepID=A0ABZ2LXN7_9BACT